MIKVKFVVGTTYEGVSHDKGEIARISEDAFYALGDSVEALEKIEKPVKAKDEAKKPAAKKADDKKSAEVSPETKEVKAPPVDKMVHGAETKSE